MQGRPSLPRFVGSLHSRASQFLHCRFFLPLPPQTPTPPPFSRSNPLHTQHFHKNIRSKCLISTFTNYHVIPPQHHSTGCSTYIIFYPLHALFYWMSYCSCFIYFSFLSFSPAFCRPVAFTRLPVSPSPLLLLLAFPPVFTYH